MQLWISCGLIHVNLLHELLNMEGVKDIQLRRRATPSTVTRDAYSSHEEMTQ